MKNLINKVRDHGKKITIHLKRHHKKYLFGAFCCGVLAFLCVHMAGSVKNIFAGGPIVPVPGNNSSPQKEIILSGAAVLRYENFASLCSTGLSRDGGVDIFCDGKGIKAVAFGAFSGYTNIHTLDLSNNKISSMDFYHEYENNYGRISVKNLILSHNNISEVKTNFPASYELVLANRQQFTFAEAVKNKNVWSDINIKEDGTIYLDNNKISSIDDRAFSGLHLSGLYLQNNVLSNVTAQMFEGINSLKKLDLGWNYIIELNKGVLAIPRLEYLLIDGNCLSEDEVSDLSDNSYRSLAICGIKDGETLECEDLTVDGQKACFNVEYDVYTPTSGEVNATLTLTGQGSFFGDYSDYSDRTGFTVNGTKYFDVSRFEPYAQDIANKDSTRLFPATVTWIKPTCSVEYSTTNPTNSGVIAYLTGCSESLEVTNNSGANNSGKDYLFTGNGSFTFQFKDDYGNTGSTTATVDWINRTAPTCNLAYNTTGWTNKNVVAYLTGCSESITGTNIQHTFTGNGEYNFVFQDLAGNTGSVLATVTWITGNTTYLTTEGYEFKWEDITICNHNKSYCIKLMDRNLGATTNDITKTGSYGYHYQWGNNHGFSPFDSSVKTNATNEKVNTEGFGPSKPYVGNQFVSIAADSEHSVIDWSITSNHNLRGGSGDNEQNDWGLISSNTITWRQGPCPDGYHVPSIGELAKLAKIWISKYEGDIRDGEELGLSYYVGGGLGSKFIQDFKIPFAGGRDNGANLNNPGLDTYIWSSSPITATLSSTINIGKTFNLYINTGGIFTMGNDSRINAFSVRCFKNLVSGHSSANDITFSISIDDNVIKAGEYADLTVKVMKNGSTFKDYTGTIHFNLVDKNGNTVDSDLYTINRNGWYDFLKSDQGKKVFVNGLKINKAGTYKLEVYDDLFKDDVLGSEIITVIENATPSSFEYDTLKFNPSYSEEMNKAYQYARYYNITTQNSIKQADITGGLNRIAMAKMIANYAINVLGKNNFDKSRNCTFKDVPTSLDKQYDYGVTKACQLGIMGINMPDNKFYPNGGVTRAEFATALSRLLYGTKDGTNKYYSTHINKLYEEGIIEVTDPKFREKRGYIMLMLMRAGEEDDD